MNKKIRLAAMDLLARREHSLQELKTKLSQRFDDSLVVTKETIDSELNKLNQEGLQSDQRFAEIFVRNRVNKFHGPIRIKNELRQRGVSKQWVDLALSEYNPDWLEIIRNLSERKYNGLAPVDAKEQAKRIRFFQYRGFTADHIRFVSDI